MGGQGRNPVGAAYSWEQIAGQLVDVYLLAAVGHDQHYARRSPNTCVFDSVGRSSACKLLGQLSESN